MPLADPTNTLALIDNALVDWDTSPDAMRWTPEPPVDRQPLQLIPDYVEFNGADITEYIRTVIVAPSVRRERAEHARMVRQYRQDIALRLMDPICAWLRANRITPGLMPLDAAVTVSGGRIVLPVYVRGEGGIAADPATGGPMRRWIRVRLRVDPPDELLEWLIAWCHHPGPRRWRPCTPLAVDGAAYQRRLRNRRRRR